MEKITSLKNRTAYILFGLIITVSGFSQTQTFNSSGTFTVPSGVTGITVEAWGGGGRGSSLSSNISGGGGGGGAYARRTLSVTPGQSYTVNVGAGSTSNAAHGGDTWFGSTSTVRAQGGRSASANNSNGAIGGQDSSSVGDVTYSGGNGASANSWYSGGGGSSASWGGNGDGADGSGNGGNAPAGGGDGGDGTLFSGGGQNGSAPGGGGGGAKKSWLTGNQNGGNGGNGRVIITWSLPEINVTGNGINIANGDASATTTDGTDFGAHDITTGSSSQNFVIHNTGSSSLGISGLSITGTNAADFSITTGAPATIAGGASATITITFNPSATGIRNATLNIANSDADESNYTFAIRGTGSNVEVNVRGNNVTISDGDTTPSATDHTAFGTTDVLSGTIVRTFTIQNLAPATTALSVGAVTLSGTGASHFAVTSAPASSVGVGGHTTFSITFDPSALGTHTATVTFANNDANENPYNFTINGVGADPEIVVAGNGLGINDGDTTPLLSDGTNFGSVNFSTGTATSTFMIYNAGSATMPLTISGVTITGAHAADFTITQYPASPIAVNGNTSLVISFNPSATGTRNATVNIANNDSNESPYNFAITGTGSNPEINVQGNGVSISDGDLSPSLADNTDFGTVSIENGSTLVNYTIYNSGVGNLNIGAITFTGAAAGDYAVHVAPASSIAPGANSTFQVKFAPLTVGTKNAMISIENDDSNENPYNFAITGLGVRTYPDTDGDGISDNMDLDDDNDGVLDTLEESGCTTSPFATSVEYTFLNETFGTGTTRSQINVNIPGATCSYCYEDGIVGPDYGVCNYQYLGTLNDGEYVVINSIADHGWSAPADHTPGDTHGRMAVFNASEEPGTFYETNITGIMPNVPITYSFWVLNIMPAGGYPASIKPNITVEFLDMMGNVISEYQTGDIGRCGTSGIGDNSCAVSEWRQFTTAVNLGSVTSFTIRFRNNAPGGGGNDLAIDDITIRQMYCDRDNDMISNIYDLDSDNDGIPDIEEAGFAHLSEGKAYMDLTTPGVWVDANYNGLHDEIDAMIAGGTYILPDSDGDGIPDMLDLDSDNDTLFDVDEAGLLNGDGDIDGDGLGDGPDTDKDGILNLYDTFAGYGTLVRPFAQDTDADGVPDYLEVDSDNDGIFDIAQTLHASYDNTNDGRIDGAGDVDKDGIPDTFDSDVLAPGSPRDIDTKLYLDFDGRNDYAESTQMLSSLPKATIMGWIKLAPDFTPTGFIMGQDNFLMRIVSNSGNKLRATAKGVSATTAVALEVDRWYHVAAVYDGSASSNKLSIYLNGEFVTSSNSASLSGSLNSSTTNFTMGKNAVASNEYFNGSIDEARVFNTALTAEQLQKMVYQEIRQNGTAIRGEVVPKDIESSLWANLLAYYRMDAYKGDVIDNYTTGTIDQGSASNLARIYNVKNIRRQLAPMPFETKLSGPIEQAVSQDNFVNGDDVLAYDWSILRINHDITFDYNNTDLGLLINSGATVVMSNDAVMRNGWYLKLDGRLDLQGRSQLVQTADSDLDAASSGHIERDQQGTTNKFNYNYWSSPVGAINSTSNNNQYTVSGVFKDGTNPANPQNITWTSGLNGAATSPITLSGYWIFKFQNVNNNYSNWASVGPNGSLMAGQGFTLKGSSAATPTQNYVFVGKPHNGTITTTVAANNLNLCGNPYASAIDAHAFITQNASSTTGSLYFWEHFDTNNTHNLQDYQGGYAVRTLVGGTPPVSPSEVSGLGSSSRTPGRFIPVGQGFFVTGSATGGTITFDNAQRAFIREDNGNSNVMFRSENELPSSALHNNNEDVYAQDTFAKLRIGFNSPNNYHRQILIGFMDDLATAGIDPGYDAIHIDTQPNDMYFVQGSAKLIIRGEGYFNDQMVFPLGVKTSAAGTVSFVLDGVENFNPGSPVYIHDNATGQYHNIADGIFEVDLPAGTNEQRFSLRFVMDIQLSTEENSWEDAIAVAYDDTANALSIRNTLADATVETVMLYNMLGQEISSDVVSEGNQSLIVIPVNTVSTGTYIVKISTTKGDLSRKIQVK